MRRDVLIGLSTIAMCLFAVCAKADTIVMTPGLTPGQCVQSTAASEIGDAPCTGRTNVITTVMGTPVTLASTQCGSVIRHGASFDYITVTFPPSPPANCEFTFEATTGGFYIDFNGQTAELPGYSGAVTHWTIPIVNAFRTNNASISLQFDGSKWTQASISSPIYQTAMQPADAAQLAHGQVYFKWNASTSRFELCPQNGPGGLIVDATMRQVPSNCLTFGQLSTTSSAVNFFYATHTEDDDLSVSSVAVSMTTGKIRVTFSSAVAGNTGDQVGIECHSIGGAIQANVLDAGVIASSTAIDLLNTSPTGLGTYTSGGTCLLVRLAASTDGHSTLDNGVEVRTNDHHYTLVGMAFIGGSHAVSDTSTQRDVASWFNRRAKTCINSYTADRTWTSTTTWGEPSTEIECEFVVFDDAHENAKSWSITGMYGNSGSGGGTLVTAGFDGTTPETEVAGQKGINISLGAHGSKSGLSEGKHFITLLAKTLTSGTSTIFGTTPATSLEIQVWQ